MTLRQQFSILTGLLVLILLSGSLLLTLSNARSAFEQQLNARAYDAATSLALSMSQTAGDTVQLQRQIDALFDRGFFALIELQVTDGSLLQRRADDVVSNVPDWLPRLFALDLLVAEADVTSGWQRLGTLRVLSHSGPAYHDLWTMVRHELQWYGLVLVLSLLYCNGYCAGCCGHWRKWKNRHRRSATANGRCSATFPKRGSCARWCWP